MQYSTDIAIPTYSAAGQTYTFVTNDVVTQINDQLSKNGTNADLVGEVKYTSFNVAAKTPTLAGMSFMKQMKFYINAYQLPEQQVAYYYNEKSDTIPASKKSVNFHINDNNLKNRFMENSFYFKVKYMPLYTHPATTITVTHNVHVKAISE
jgi:hypothetical protein